MWHVLHTAPHSESALAKYFAIQDIATYAPKFPVPPRTRPGSVRDQRSRWVFPGYLFIQPPAPFDGWDKIRWAPGVRRLLQVDGEPAIIDDTIIDHLRHRLEDGSLSPAQRPLKPGDRVVIERGPLAMVDAIFDRALNASNRVQILVNLLGRPVRVRVDPTVLATPA